MDGGVSQPGNGVAVCDGSISLVLCQSIARTLHLQFAHPRVTGGLGKHRGGCDAQASLVPFDERGERDFVIRFEQEIRQQVVGDEGQRLKGAFGCQARRGADAERVDLLGGSPAQCSRW
jgi:hypothetical protein